MKNKTRNILIATSIGVATLVSGLAYKQYQDRASLASSCQSARELRQEAAGLMGDSVMRGFGGLSAEATVLMQDASDIIADCNQKGL